MRDLPALGGVLIAVPIALLMWACLALLVWWLGVIKVFALGLLVLGSVGVAWALAEVEDMSWP